MKTKRASAATLELPQNPFPEIFSMVQDFAQESSSKGQELFSYLKGFFQKGRNKNSIKDYLPFAFLVIFVLGGLFFVGRFLQQTLSGQSVGATDTRVELKPARATQSLDKTFQFPLKDDAGKEFSKLKFFLDDAELRDEIIIGGQKSVALKGRTYLILTIKLTNSSDKFINMKVRNYVRLSANGNKEDWFAATIHNDDVEIQPESTKQTRLGFPINDTDKDLLIRVGDLEGKKTLIPLNFN